jgi:cysteine synthase A
MMRALGAEVEILATPERKVTPELLPRLRARVEEIRTETGAFWTAQMENPDQTEGYAALADELLAACPGSPTSSRSWARAGARWARRADSRRANPSVRTSVVEPAEAPYLSAGRGGAHAVEGIALTLAPPLFDASLVDERLAVPEAEGRAMARRLAREEGLLVGASTGMNLAAAVRIATRLPPAPRW